MTSNKVLVTGADQHQALAVIRGLGMAGIPVLAASPQSKNIGFASRYAAETALYTNPHTSTERFVCDIVDLVKRHAISMIIPAVESTLVALDSHRDLIEEHALLAAPDSTTLEWAVDKLKTIQLAEQLGVPVPKTLATNDLQEALSKIEDFQFPVALKPRGNSLHQTTANQLQFKVKYARTRQELERMLRIMHQTGTLPLVQEYVHGIGVCAATLFDRGQPIVILPYQRLRELPLTGGVSVLRKTLPPDEQLETIVTRLLQAKQWHGAAMVEFKYDHDQNRYTLMEVNGRFPASTALSLDAGINLPYLTYCLHAGLPMPTEQLAYRVGVQERWLQGDFRALMAHLRGKTWREAVPQARARLPSNSRAVRDFLLDFRPGMHYDEFKWHDPWPGVRETQSWLRSSSRTTAGALRRLGRWSQNLSRSSARNPHS